MSAGAVGAMGDGVRRGRGKEHAVVTLAADHLNDRGAQTRGVVDHLHHGARSHDGGVGAGGIGDRAVPNHIIDNDDAARPGQTQRPAQVLGVGRLIGIDEDHVKRALELSKGVYRVAHNDRHEIGQTGEGDVVLRYPGVMIVGFQGDEPAIGRQGAGEPEGAVSAEGSDLENRAGLMNLGRRVQQLALRRRDGDGRQTGGRTGGQGGVELRVVADHGLDNVGINLVP